MLLYLVLLILLQWLKGWLKNNMANIIPLTAPFLNTNEDNVMLAALEVSEGQLVSKGDLLAVFESTKSSEEFSAEKNGRIVGISYKSGDMIQSGQVWAYLGEVEKSDDEDEFLAGFKSDKSIEQKKFDDSLRFSKPALKLANEFGLSPSDFDQDGIITEKMVKMFIAQRKGKIKKTEWVQVPANEAKKLLIYGAGGHGRSLAELIRLLPSYEIVGFVDDGAALPERVLGLRVLGDRGSVSDLFVQGICLAANGVGGIGNINQRVEVFEALRDSGFFCPTFVHPFAFIEASAKMSNAVQVFPFAYIGSQVSIGYGSIVNTGAIVSHDCQLGEMVNLSPGATLAGGVVVGDKSLVGMRVTINLGVSIGANARIGNGATVKADVPENGVVPAGAVWPLRT